jgi:predicted phosphoribosyltransferase
METNELGALFKDRVEAGKHLASALSSMTNQNAIVLAIPRGGVVVGYEVAKALAIQLDVIVPRKISAPENPELAIGAVAEDGTVVYDSQLVEHLNVSKAYVNEQSAKQMLEIQCRLRTYRGDSPSQDLKGRIVILVDDGVATGYTMKAALSSVRKREARTVIVAVPVAPVTTAEELSKEADRFVCLYTPEPFHAIGQFYENFAQTTDEEVKQLLALAKHLQKKT